MAAASAALPIAANAASSIAIDSVVQRWPWNNKVDITYTVVGGQDLANGNYQKIVFTTVIDGITYTIDGVTDVGASANEGTHTVTWTLPSGVKSTSCTMSAAIYASDAPSGDDYMIVDLTKTSGNITWEGLMATQEASNERYNTAIYKTDKLVLRKVPAGGPYPTGDDANYASINARKMWTTAKDYYIGVFPVTQYQYQKICGYNPSRSKTAYQGNEVTHRPVEMVSWNDLRLSTMPTSPLPTVTSQTGTFLQRLNYITGNKYGFDLPTEVMSEIAERAGATTAYYWGDVVDKSYIVYSDNAGGYTTVAVGSRLPNAWGLYDTAGNVWEWCLDGDVTGNLTARTDAFTPAWESGTSRRLRGGGDFRQASSVEFFRVSFHTTQVGGSLCVGFRVSMIAD